MSVQWKCDLCGKPGFIYPKTEPLMKTKMVVVEQPDPKDPTKKIKKKLKKTVPAPGTRIRRQNQQNGNVEIHEIPAVRDLEPRALIVMLKSGMENVQKDFCVPCYEKHIKKHVEQLFEKLASIKSQ